MSLATARVLVVENDPNDAAGLLSALGAGGMGAVYLTGNVEDLTKLSGIRLAFLDLVLDGTGTEPSLDQLAGIIESCIDVKNGPWIAIAWTSRPEDVDKLRAYLGEKLGEAAPLIVGQIDKADVRSDGQWDLPQILKLARAEVAKLSPLELINEWEQGVHNAATRVTSDLMTHPPTAANAEKTGSAHTWTQPASRALGLLLRETATEEVLAAAAAIANAGPPFDQIAKKTLSYARRNLYEGLHPLLIDAVDTLAAGDDEPSYLALGGIIQAGSAKVSAGEASRMNSAILLGPIGAGVMAGNVYVLTEELFEMLHEQGTLKDLVKGLGRDLVRLKKDDPASLTKHIEVVKQGIPVVVEITPECDQLREAPPSARLLAGLAILEEHSGKIVSKPGLWILGPVTVLVDGLQTERRLVLAARQPLTASRSKLAAHAPWHRLRREPTTDLRAWAAAQASRVGFLRFEPPDK